MSLTFFGLLILLHKMFAPFQPTYINPMVAVKLVNVPHNKLIEVVCTVHADGIITDNIHDPYEGKVTFKLNIQG